MSLWSIYLLRCRDGKLYTGISNDVAKRLSQHEAGQGAKFTRGKGPFELAFTHEVGDRSRASQLEWRIKRLGKADKERLVTGALEIDLLLKEA
jgi:putative endonuclease